MPDDGANLEHRLERGDIVVFETCPFSLPTGDDLAFLFQQRLQGGSKNISYNPSTHAVSGFTRQSAEQEARLQSLLRAFSAGATAWLSALAPRYAAQWQPDRASWRPEEEATRRLRLTARNDLLHFDAFPSRPTGGHRILRLYVNVNPSDDRVWATSDTFAKVLERYGDRVGIPSGGMLAWVERVRHEAARLFQPMTQERTEYDDFMLRLHHFLKANEEFQDRAPRRLWHFPPGSAWLLFADAVSHAELRGQYALEHSFFIAPESLALPDEAPRAFFERLRQSRTLPQAA